MTKKGQKIIKRGYKISISWQFWGGFSQGDLGQNLFFGIMTYQKHCAVSDGKAMVSPARRFNGRSPQQNLATEQNSMPNNNNTSIDDPGVIRDSEGPGRNGSYG